MKKYVVWVENTHSNFGQYPFNEDRYDSPEDAQKAFDALFSPQTVKLLEDAGLYFTIAEI